jgi:polysaccharide export outer membrane protein
MGGIQIIEGLVLVLPITRIVSQLCSTSPSKPFRAGLLHLLRNHTPAAKTLIFTNMNKNTGNIYSRVTRCFVVIAAVSAFITSSNFAGAQQPAAAESVAPAATASTQAETTAGITKIGEVDDRYRIGAGDVLDIRVFNRPTLSRDAVRVDARGMIRMPLLEEGIAAACRTESELAQLIAASYLKYLRTPNVEVFVKEYNSQPVAVIGAVNQPGRFQLQRRVRLLELISFAGGPNAKAGGRINIVRTTNPLACNAPGDAPAAETVALETSPSTAAPDEMNNLVAVDLNSTMRGGTEANPYVQPGDIISLPDAQQILIIGNIVNPTALPIKDRPITISTAIAMAGGTLPDTKKSKVKIVRQLPGNGGTKDIIVNLDDISKRRSEDIALQANDIVEVPSSTGKRMLRGLIGTIVPTVARLPVQVIR